MPSFQVVHAGQDISSHCLESSITIQDQLGQGPGVAAGGSGRASTLDILTDLGPAAAAVGNGTVVHTPTLVRQGDLYVYDTAGNCIYGGKVTLLDDKDKITDSGLSKVWTNIEAHDWWQDLDRVNVVNEVFDGQTDLYVIKYLAAKYYPSLGLTKLPKTTSYTLGPLNFKNKSLQKCLQMVANKTGYAIWVDPQKYLHYAAPGQFGSAPFGLAQNPDFRTTFQMGFDEYTVDDTAAINRVTFYGGKHLSNDFTQDLSPQANGNLDTLTLAYYPHKCTDGKFHVHIGGVDQAVGFYGSVGTTNVLKKNGGSADVLLNTDAHTFIFNTAPSNTGANSVTATYRFETPLVVQVVDQASVAFYGRYLDGTIADNSVFDAQTAVQRCRVLLNEQSRGLTTLKVHCWKPGLQSGMLLSVTHNTRGISGTFLIQEVDVQPLGAGNFQYNLTCGAWNWNLVDFIMSTAQSAATDDTSTDETATIAEVKQESENLTVVDSWSKQTRTMSNYLLRTSAVGDGRDLYFGLASL